MQKKRKKRSPTIILPFWRGRRERWKWTSPGRCWWWWTDRQWGWSRGGCAALQRSRWLPARTAEPSRHGHRTCGARTPTFTECGQKKSQLKFNRLRALHDTENNPAEKNRKTKRTSSLIVDVLLTFSTRTQLILPDVFIVADFRLFHSSVPVHFVDDYSESQEINLRWGRDKQKWKKLIFNSETIPISWCYLISKMKQFKLTRMIKHAGPIKLHMKWFSVLSQQL